MCGMVARLGPPDRTDLARATMLLGHRGIRSKIAQCEVGALGHVRLPIVGLGPEHDQPIRVDKWLIGFVGEILDFREQGRNWTDAPCDVDYVVEAWMNHGPHGLTLNDGFWAVMAIDAAEAKLHILCDYLAQKPMYYRADRHVQAAASELDPLVSMGPASPDEIYLSSVIKWGYCPDTTRTPYEQIKHVLPGEHVVIDSRGHVERTIVDKLSPRPMYVTDLKQEIIRACKRRIKSADVPAACLVSGGLDSAIVYSIASRHGSLQPYFAFDRDLPERSEQEFDRVTEVIGSDNSAQLIPWKDRVSTDQALEYMQEPIDLGSLKPQVALSESIEEDVCLTGDGADEVFGGYGRSARYDSQYTDIFHELVAWHLPRLDRVMMRNRIEVRSPFLARRVVEGAMGVTHELRHRKDVLRILFKRDVPESVMEAPKIPLRTQEVDSDREANSIELVQAFREKRYGDG